MKADEDAALEKLKVDKADESSSKEKEVEHKSNIGKVKVLFLFKYNIFGIISLNRNIGSIIPPPLPHMPDLYQRLE